VDENMPLCQTTYGAAFCERRINSSIWRGQMHFMTWPVFRCGTMTFWFGEAVKPYGLEVVPWQTKGKVQKGNDIS